MLGGGAIIGDMSVRESGGGPPRRTATVVALTELVTYKVPLKEFKRRMPADVLEVRQRLFAVQISADQRSQTCAGNPHHGFHSQYSMPSSSLGCSLGHCIQQKSSLRCPHSNVSSISLSCCACAGHAPGGQPEAGDE